MKNWILENKMLSGLLAFMVVGVLGLGAWLYFCYDSYASARENTTHWARRSQFSNRINYIRTPATWILKPRK